MLSRSAALRTARPATNTQCETPDAELQKILRGDAKNVGAAIQKAVKDYWWAWCLREAQSRRAEEHVKALAEALLCA